MNGPPSPESENVIDVFVLSKSTADAPINPAHLEQKGYRVTLFSDSKELLDSLRYGKPNILVCDSLSLGADAADFCRRIKADPDLWMVPVLIVTSASRLTNLLQVLDCNADNFIAAPFDTPYLLSLIEMMLVTPVEQPTPEQVSTQFKIRHDDQEFVVMADRRKLLEFILSSFEIVVSRNADLDRAMSEIASLSARLTKTEDSTAEQIRINGILNGNLQQREEAISQLNDEIRVKAGAIAGLTREKEFLVAEREENKARIAAAEEMNQALTREKNDAVAAGERTIGELRDQAAARDRELSATMADLAKVREELAAATVRYGDAEGRLAELEPQKETAERSLRALTLEFEQLKNSCITERNRAIAASQEAKSLMEAKSESERDLTRIIDELREKAKQQAEEIAVLREGRVNDRDRIVLLENQFTALSETKKKSDADAKATIERQQSEIGEQKNELDRLNLALGEKTREAETLADALRSEESAHAGAAAETESLKGDLDAARQALDREKAAHASAVSSLDSALREHEAKLASLQGAHAEARTNLDAHRDDLAHARQELAAVVGERATLKARLDESASRISSLEQQISGLTGEQETSSGKIRTYSEEISRLRSALEAGQNERKAVGESLQAAEMARERAVGLLQKEQGETERLRALLADEQERAGKERERLTAEIHSVQDQYNREQIRLSTLLESEQAKASETSDRARKESEPLHQRIGQLSAELTGSDARIRALEEKLRAMESQSREAKTMSDRQIGELMTELTASSGRVKTLEAQVITLGQEKQKAEATVLALSDEIDQARAALADEWEEHVSADERLAAATREKPEPVLPVRVHSSDEPAAPPVPAVITRTTTLPAEVPENQHAVAVVPDTPVAPVPAGAGDAEDLFEDVVVETSSRKIPTVSIIRDADPDLGSLPFDGFSGSGVVEYPGSAPAAESYAVGSEGESGSGDLFESAGGADVDGGDHAAVPDAESSLLARAPAAPVMYSFNRTQWFDLLKWAHHSGALSQEQRLQIVRMGRLVQKGRRLTRQQDEQVRDILSLVQSLGYRFS